MKMKSPIVADPGKAAALAILLGIVVVFVVGTVVPVRMLHRHYDEALEQARDKLERYRRVIATRPELQRRAEQFKTDRDAKAYYLKSDNPALAAAEIQALAKSVIDSSSGKLTSMQVLAPKDEANYRQIAVNVQFNGTIPAIRTILFKLENSQPYLFVDNLVIRSLMGGAQRSPTAADPEMMVQFDLSGYMVKGLP